MLQQAGIVSCNLEQLVVHGAPVLQMPAATRPEAGELLVLDLSFNAFEGAVPSALANLNRLILDD